MEVVETSSAILCNSEVLQFLREQREENLLKKNLYRKDNKGGQAATVILETLTHLDKSPCANLNPERVAAFLDKLSATELTLNSAEKLHILNHCPTTPVEIQILIEDGEERFTEDQINQLLDLVHTELLDRPLDSKADPAS